MMDKLLNHPWLVLVFVLGVGLCIAGYLVRIRHESSVDRQQDLN